MDPMKRQTIAAVLLTAVQLTTLCTPPASATDARDVKRWINVSATAVDDAILVMRMDDRSIVPRQNGADVWIQPVRVETGDSPVAVVMPFDVMNQYRIDCKKSTYNMIGRLEAGMPARPLANPRTLPELPNICDYLSRRNK